MPQPRLSRVGDLDIDQHLEIQVFSWRLQAVGQVLMGLFLVAALAGLFGSGPLSRAHAGDPAGLEVEYGRFARRTLETTMIVTLGPRSSGNVTLWIAEPYLAAAPLIRVIPEPERVALEGGRVILTLRLLGERPRVQITVKPEDFGVLQTQIGIGEGPEVSFTQVVYP